LLLLIHCHFCYFMGVLRDDLNIIWYIWTHIYIIYHYAFLYCFARSKFFEYWMRIMYILRNDDGSFSYYKPSSFIYYWRMVIVMINEMLSSSQAVLTKIPIVPIGDRIAQPITMSQRTVWKHAINVKVRISNSIYSIDYSCGFDFEVHLWSRDCVCDCSHVIVFVIVISIKL